MYNNVTNTRINEEAGVTIRSRFVILLAEKGLKENRRITIAEVSRDTEIDQRTLGQYAKDKIKRYDSFVLDRLCKYFGCQVGDLIVYAPE